MRCRFEGEVTFASDERRDKGQRAHAPANVLSESDVLRIATRAIQLYAETHPRPPQVNMSQAAQMLGLSRHTVSKMVRAGQFKLNRCGLIPIEQIDKILAGGM